MACNCISRVEKYIENYENKCEMRIDEDNLIIDENE